MRFRVADDDAPAGVKPLLVRGRASSPFLIALVWTGLWSTAPALSRLPAKSSEAAVAHQLATLFVPEPEGEGFKARKQRDRRHALKDRLGFVAFLEVIIGNPRTQMMDVMKPDVAGEPLQHHGQFVEGTTSQRRRGIIPFLAAFPVNSFELVLHIKQPHSGRAGHQEHR